MSPKNPQISRTHIFEKKKKCRCFCNHGIREGNVIVAGVEAEDDNIVGKELLRHLYILENSDWELSCEMEQS